MTTSSAMRIACYRTARELLDIRPQINKLNLESIRPDPFSTCEFYVNFLEHGDWRVDCARSRLCFLAAFRGGQLVGYLAMKEVTRAGWLGPIRRLDLLVGHEADRPHVVARPEHLEEVSERFYRYLAERRDWDFLELQQQDAASAFLRSPFVIRFPGRWISHFPGWDNYAIQLRWKSLSDYFACMSRNMRSALKRQLRALIALGELELIFSADPQSTPALFALYCDIESRSWKCDTNVAVTRTAMHKRYYETLLDSRQPMRVVIHLLLLDGIPIAGLVCGSFEGPTRSDLYGLHIAFDSRLRALAPGSAILLMGMRYAIARGYTTFNLLSGFGYYKERWLADATPTTSVQIYRIGSRRFVHRVCGNLKRALIRPNSNRKQIHCGEDSRLDTAKQKPATAWPSAQHVAEERARYYPLIAQAFCGATKYVSARSLKSELSFMDSRTPLTTSPARISPTCLAVVGSEEIVSLR